MVTADQVFLPTFFPYAFFPQFKISFLTEKWFAEVLFFRLFDLSSVTTVLWNFTN